MHDDTEIRELELSVGRRRTRARDVSPEIVAYVDGARRLDQHRVRQEYEGLANRNFRLIMRFSKRSLTLLGGLAAALLFLGIISVHLTKQGGELARRNMDTIVRIQVSRYDTIKETCIQQNEHHTHTVEKLDQLIAAVPEPRRAEAEASKQYTILLIDALQPYRNCAKVLAKAGFPQGPTVAPNLRAPFAAGCDPVPRRLC